MRRYHWIVASALIFCLSAACRDKAAMAELEKFRAQAKLEEQNKAIVSREWEAWIKGDYEAFKEVVAPEFVWCSPSASAKPRSRDEAIETCKMGHQAFSYDAFDIKEILATGSNVVVRYIVRLTHQGEFAGLPGTGNKIELSGIAIHRLENGKVVEEREEFDTLGFMQQLGMELKPKEAKKK
jgi:steroid delta-isomerase-like uncharacterized protein